MGFLESFNRGLSGNDGYEFADRQVACAHCGGTAFDKGEPERHGPRLPELRPPRVVLVIRTAIFIK